MGIDSSEDIESPWLSGAVSEAPSEKSEKHRESSKKAQSQLQKTKKDEQKARGDNDALFQILTHFIKNPYYEELIPVVSRLLEEGFPSRYILSLVALVYPDAAVYFFHAVGTPEKAMKITTLHRYDVPTEFQEENIHTTLREWMSIWINSMEKYLILTDNSVITSQKLSSLLRGSSRETAIFASERFFRFFFVSRNLLLPERQAFQYARFITDISLQAVNRFLEGADTDLQKNTSASDQDLFGIA